MIPLGSGHTFNLQQIRELNRGGTPYMNGDKALVLPKGKLPDNFAGFQGAKPMGPGQYMRSLVATGAAAGQRVGDDFETTKRRLMSEWRGAQVGSPGDAKASASGTKDAAAAEAVLKRVTEMVNTAHMVDKRNEAMGAGAPDKPGSPL